MSASTVVRGVAAACTLAALAGCSAASLTATAKPGPTQGEANIMAQQFAKAFSNAMAATSPNRGPSFLSSGGPFGYSATFVNVSMDHQTNCTSGGYIHILGSMSGNIDDNGTGVLQLQVTETINSWACDSDLIFDGDPYLSAAGTFSFINGNLGSAASIEFGGGVKWTGGGSGSCSVQMTAIFNPDLSGHLSGQVCGYQVDETM